MGEPGPEGWLQRKSREWTFRAFHRFNLWFDAGSRSGPGSSLEITGAVRRALPDLVKRLGVRTLLDVPCGDFAWMKAIDLHLQAYTGADIVSALVEENRRLYGSDSRSFVKLDLVRDDLPRADLVLCRDCLVHLPHRAALGALDNVRRSGSTYLLTTTFPPTERNRDIAVAGPWRPLNLQRAPFGLPEPIEIIDEANTWKADRFPGKSLGLWRIRDLPG